MADAMTLLGQARNDTERCKLFRALIRYCARADVQVEAMAMFGETQRLTGGALINSIESLIDNMFDLDNEPKWSALGIHEVELSDSRSTTVLSDGGTPCEATGGGSLVLSSVSTGV